MLIITHSLFVWLKLKLTNSGVLARFCRSFHKKWEWAVVPTLGMPGGIIVLWRFEVGVVTPVVQSRHELNLVISAHKAEEWILTIVHNP